nr:adhesin biosynthesis transcription regulatory family protein [Escherichia coli]
MSESQYWLLVEISSIHSEKVIDALKEYMVFGGCRKDICKRHGVSQSYFSYSLKRFQHTHQTVCRLVPFYISEDGFSYKG